VPTPNPAHTLVNICFKTPLDSVMAVIASEWNTLLLCRVLDYPTRILRIRITGNQELRQPANPVLPGKRPLKPAVQVK